MVLRTLLWALAKSLEGIATVPPMTWKVWIWCRPPPPPLEEVFTEATLRRRIIAGNFRLCCNFTAEGGSAGVTIQPRTICSAGGSRSNATSSSWRLDTGSRRRIGIRRLLRTVWRCWIGWESRRIWPSVVSRWGTREAAEVAVAAATTSLRSRISWTHSGLRWWSRGWRRTEIHQGYTFDLIVQFYLVLAWMLKNSWISCYMLQKMIKLDGILIHIIDFLFIIRYVDIL